MISSQPISILVPEHPGGPLVREREISTVIFDLDGTVADTRALVVEALVQLLHRQGRREQDEHVAELVPLGFPAFLEPLGLTALRGVYWQVYQALARNARFFPWTFPVLRRLRARGIRVGVLTAVPGRIAQVVIKAAGAEQLIDCVVGFGDALPKPNPEGVLHVLERCGGTPNTAMMIGDGVDDILAGNTAGCLSVGVGWGLHPLLELAEAGAHITFLHDVNFACWIRGTVNPLLASVINRRTAPATSYSTANVLPVPVLACPTCAAPTSKGTLCNDCERRSASRDNWVKSVSCAWLYTEGGPLANDIHSFKGVVGEAQLQLASPLGACLLAQSFARASAGEPDQTLNHALPGPLIPIPSSAASLARRGFAPVQQLLRAFLSPLLGDGATATGVAGMGWPAFVAAINVSGSGWEICDALIRVGDEELKQHGGAERAAIAARSYQVLPEMMGHLRGREVYLVEDVITTGATIQTCARLLREQGARAVHVIALARSYHLQINRTTITCPVCKQGILRKRFRHRDNHGFYGCSRWRRNDPQSCGYTCEAYEVEGAPSPGTV